MLNSILVEQFAGIHRQKKSGVLTVVSPGFRLRFCIEDGDPVGLDFCADKDLVLAQALVDFHKIGPEMFQMVVDARRLGKDTVTDTVRRQQVVNEEEISQVTRSMVEDTLVRCFSNAHQELVFDERDDASTFDFDNSAIRLRIGTEVLLNTVQSRVAEIDRVMREVGGESAIFSLSENESGSTPLSELEKHVLNFIDGRKTVDDIAVAFRESTLSMSRLLHGMVAKGAIKRTSIGGVSRLRSAVQATAELATAPPSTPQLLSDFIPHRAPEPVRSNRAVMAILVSVLLLVSVIWYLVMLSQRRNEALDSASTSLSESLVAGKWSDAMAQVDKARAEAGNDLLAIERVKNLDKQVKDALNKETDLIKKMIAKEDYHGAKEHFGLLPSALQPPELASDIQRGQNVFLNRSDAVVAQVTRLLENGNAAQAMQLITRTAGRESDAANDFLSRWRLSSLEKAGSSSLPLSQRTALVNQILATDPDQRQKEQIERIRLDFSRLQQRTAEQVKSLRKQAELGAFMEVESAWEQAKLGDQLRGTPLAGEADSLKKLTDQIAKEMRALEAEGRLLIKSSNDAKAMGAYDARVKQMLGKWSLASNAKEVTMLASLLNELCGLINERKAGDEATALDAWIIERQPSAPIATLVTDRSKNLKELEAAAAKALETAQVFARQNDWETNERMLKELLARPQWLRTVARVTAQHDLDSIATLRGQRNAWQEELRKALISGDITNSLAIAKKMGLSYPPLVIHSRPSGAKVLQNGKSIGSTPLILDMPAGERAGLVLRLQLTDFDSAEVQGKNAEGGWFLPVALERTSTSQHELNMTLTAKLSACNGRLWAANRQAGVALAPGQPVQHFTFENPSTDDVVSRQPLYAGAMGTADGIWYPTREGIAIRMSNHGIERLPIAGRTDLPLVAYTSELIVGRRFVILAGIDGALHASDDRNPLAAWHGKQGTAFVLGPILRDNRVLIARTSGQIDVHLADDGKLAASHTLDGEVLSAWEAKDGLHCLTPTSHWICRGEEQPTHAPLPSEIRSAGREVLITPDNHAWVLMNDSWRDVGRFEGKVTASPMQWAGHAVIPLGKQLTVVGPKGFTVASSSEFLAPEQLGNQLAVATVGGMVRFYAP